MCARRLERRRRRRLAIGLQNPLSDAARPETELLIFMSEDDNFVLRYQARPPVR
jgi:hypothetical protein